MRDYFILMYSVIFLRSIISSNTLGLLEFYVEEVVAT